MPALHIRPAQVDDAPLILRFIKELAVYEKAEQEVVASEDDIRRTLFGAQSPARALICTVDGVEAGFAVYFFNYSTWQGRKGLYLEDLYVTPAFRQVGAGKTLLRHLARIAVAEGCGRFEWSVLDWNELAPQFYRSIGAWPMDEWVRYRMAGAALADFAGSGEEPGPIPPAGRESAHR
jgi:GNAT superfamily N-acetyltransferase